MGHKSNSDTPTKSYVDAVERFGGDVVITFQDRKVAVYSASFLYASLSSAKELPEEEGNVDE